MSITIKQYKGIEVTVPTQTISDADVAQRLEAILSQNPKKAAKDVVEEGTTALIDYAGYKDGVAFDGGTAQNYELVIGSHSFIPGFEEQMVGMKKGETRDLNLQFPEIYHAPELAGAEVVFKVTVHAIYTQEPADLTDEYAKCFQLPGVSTAEEFKAFLRDSMEREAQMRTEEIAAEAVMAKLTTGTTCELDEEKVQNAIEGQLDQISHNMMRQGITLDQYLEITGSSLDDIKKELRPGAEQHVMLEAALKEVARLEGITVTPEEVEEHFGRIADSYQMPVEAIKAQVNTESVEYDLMCRKAHELIVKAALITYN